MIRQALQAQVMELAVGLMWAGLAVTCSIFAGFALISLVQFCWNGGRKGKSA